MKADASSVKNLLIMRHAKSSWDEAGLSDFERPLNKRGLRDAPRMAQWLVQNDLLPDFVIASTANRAQSTARLVMDGMREEKQVDAHFTDDLYHAPAESYLEYISILGEPHRTLLMVGHNPGVERLVYHLSDRWEEMPTAAIAWFQFEANSWLPIESKQPDNLREVWRPKELDWSQ